MFEIGPSLREARERRGLAYSQVEADTAIRSRYIRALEEEEFDILPGPTYTKGFLRSYAEYLGLDGELFVDEFNSRHHDPRREFDQPIASHPRSRPHQHRRRRESHLVMIVLAAIVAVTSVIFLVALKQPSNRAPLLTTPSTHTTSSTGNGLTTEPSTTKKADTKGSHKAAHKQFTVTLTASERCWVAITTAPSGGDPVMSTHGTDLSGYPIDPAVDATVTFKSKAPVYMSVGAPGSLQVSINGKTTPLPSGAAAGTPIRVSRTGLSPA